MRKITQDDDFLMRLANLREYDYQIFAEVRTGIILPEKKNYKIRVSLGELDWTSGQPIQGIDEKMYNYNRWNYRVCESFKSVHETLDEFPAVYIYLIEEKKGFVGVGGGDFPICYWRGRP